MRKPWTKSDQIDQYHVDLSFFVALHTVHLSGWRLDLTSQLGRLNVFSALAFANPL